MIFFSFYTSSWIERKNDVSGETRQEDESAVPPALRRRRWMKCRKDSMVISWNALNCNGSISFASLAFLHIHLSRHIVWTTQLQVKITCPGSAWSTSYNCNTRWIATRHWIQWGHWTNLSWCSIPNSCPLLCAKTVWPNRVHMLNWLEI